MKPVYVQLAALWASVASLLALFLAFITDVYQTSPSSSVERIRLYEDTEQLAARIEKLEKIAGVHRD